MVNRRPVVNKYYVDSADRLLLYIANTPPDGILKLRRDGWLYRGRIRLREVALTIRVLDIVEVDTDLWTPQADRALTIMWNTTKTPPRIYKYRIYYELYLGDYLLHLGMTHSHVINLVVKTQITTKKAKKKIVKLIKKLKKQLDMTHHMEWDIHPHPDCVPKSIILDCTVQISVMIPVTTPELHTIYQQIVKNNT
ncbi:MAG: hypothetical protein QXY12_06625 [Pyrobaculum sp.]|jgi:hypothetical protein